MGLFGKVGRFADKQVGRAARATKRATVGQAKKAYNKQVRKATRQAMGTSPRATRRR